VQTHPVLPIQMPPIRVLLADDHPVVRAGLASVLSAESDFELVGEAGDGKHAVTLARQLRPDVVLMDLRMPHLDGIAAIGEITRDLPNVRVLALSTYDGDADIRRALAAGARGYLLKDMLLTQLVSAVRAVHDGERVLPALLAERLLEHSFEPELTERELEVLTLVARGLGNKAIASEIGRSSETVKAHLKSIVTKLGVANRTEAVTVALSRGLIHLGRWTKSSCRRRAAVRGRRGLGMASRCWRARWPPHSRR
jgi:DNA-binding NarL/FixJ family response regulator